MLKIDRAARKTLTYVIIVVALVVVLILQLTLNPSRHSLPFPELGDSSSIDGIQITTQEGTLSLRLDQERWLVGDREYPGDKQKIASFLESITTLEKAEVVATRGNYAEYGLDDESVREVILFQGRTRRLTLQVGSRAVSGNVLYGRIDGSSEVVILPGSLDERASSDPADFRNREMLNISENDIIRAQLVSDGFETVTVRRTLPAGDGEEEPEREWEADPGEEIGPDAFRNLFQELKAVRAEGFLDESVSPGTPFARLVIEEQNGKRTELAISPPREDRQYPVKISGNPYPFTIPEWRVRRLLLGMERYFRQFNQM